MRGEEVEWMENTDLEQERYEKKLRDAMGKRIRRMSLDKRVQRNKWSRCKWGMEIKRTEIEEEKKEERINGMIKEKMMKGLRQWCNKKLRDLKRRWKICEELSGGLRNGCLRWTM